MFTGYHQQLSADANFAPKMKDIFPKFALKQLSTYIAIVVVFIYNVVLGKDLQCSCGQQTLVCSLYMMLPFFILFVLQLWTDKKFQIAWKYTCACTWTCRFNKECCNKCCHRICCCCYCCTCCINYTKRLCKVFCIFLHHIMKAVFIGLLWVASVLIDGDWYVCCWNDQSKQQKQLACKAETDMTAMERKIIAELKDWSWVIGISLLFGALFLAALMSSFGRIKCGEDSACCNRKNLYYKVILEEEKDVLREILTKTAKEKLAEDFGNKIRGKQWEGCFDVAKDLIKAEENQENELEMTEVRL